MRRTFAGIVLHPQAGKLVVAAVVATVAWCAEFAVYCQDGPLAGDAQRANDNALNSKARFGVHREQSGWLLTSPTDRHFFSLGVGVVTRGPSEKEYNAAQPVYASWRYYGSPQAWADANLMRLKSWKFTTIGGWGDYAVLNQSKEQTMYLTPVVPLGAAGGAPWLDMWDPKHLAAVERLAHQEIDPLRDDPRVIGYYCDNELGWWNAELWRLTLEQPPGSAQRKKLISMLRKDYGGNWLNLLKDFEPAAGVDGWDELKRGGTLQHRPGSAGIRTMRRFLAVAAERYYQLMSEVVRRHDPDALFLGDRYQSFYYPEVARAAGKYVDVVSTNLSASWNDGSFLRCYLDSLHKLADKPILVSEFYMASHENHSGNKNSGDGFPLAPTQTDRAQATRRSLNELAGTPSVVGAEWFQFCDEPPHGRYDGEDFNFGLVDIEDRPYAELTKAFASFDVEKAVKARMTPRVDATKGVPRAPTDPFESLGYMTGLMNWDRERGFVPPATEAPLADLYLCWNSEAVYFGIYAIDPVEKRYYVDGRIPEVDRAKWRLRLNDGASVTARFGGGLDPTVDHDAVAIKSFSGVDHGVRLIAVARIPASLAGVARFDSGSRISLFSTVTTHGRAYQFDWRGNFVLAE